MEAPEDPADEEKYFIESKTSGLRAWRDKLVQRKSSRTRFHDPATGESYAYKLWFYPVEKTADGSIYWEIVRPQGYILGNFIVCPGFPGVGALGGPLPPRPGALRSNAGEAAEIMTSSAPLVHRFFEGTISIPFEKAR